MRRTQIFTCFLAFYFHRKAFKLAFELLQGGARTGCQSIIVFATDGVDNDGDPVRCGPGSYTRSGYVPGQTCQYDWNDVWDEVAARNRYMSPRVSCLRSRRILSIFKRRDEQASEQTSEQTSAPVVSKKMEGGGGVKLGEPFFF